MQPSPRAETSRPLFPSLRFCIVFLLRDRFSHLQVRVECPRSGILILPISCLFLSSLKNAGAFTEPRGYPCVDECEATATMKNRRGDASPASGRVRELRSELARKIALFMGSAENRTTDIPGVTLHRRTAPTAPCPATYEPSVTVIAQGRKRVDLGRHTFIYGESRYLLTSVDLPIVSQIIEASEETPCLAMSLKLEMPVIRELLTKEEIQVVEVASDSPAMAIGEVKLEFL